MAHHHAHGASCNHHHAPTAFHGAFALGIFLNSAFVAIEFFFGWWAHSLALVADAAHNLGDVLALAVAWLGYHLMHRRTDAQSRYTLGLGRVSIYATLFNGLTLVLSSAWIVIEALERLNADITPMPWVIAGVALVGIAINGTTAWLLAKGQSDINIRGAMLHMLADALISAGVVVTALLLVFTGWVWLDPVVSIVISGIIVWGSWPLLREGIALALDAVPGHLNRAEIESYIKTRSGVTAVYLLYIWPLSTSQTALNVHLGLQEGIDAKNFLAELHRDLKDRFKINAITVQIENDHLTCQSL